MEGLIYRLSHNFMKNIHRVAFILFSLAMLCVLIYPYFYVVEKSEMYFFITLTIVVFLELFISYIKFRKKVHKKLEIDFGSFIFTVSGVLVTYIIVFKTRVKYSYRFFNTGCCFLLLI